MIHLSPHHKRLEEMLGAISSAAVRHCGVLLLVFAIGATHAHAQPLEIDLPANAIAYSAITNMLYATIPSSGGLGFGNRLIQIAPNSAAITSSVIVGSEPGSLAVSRDTPIAYVGLNGDAAVRQIDLNTMTAGATFTLGNSMFLGPYYPGQIAVMPDFPDTVAVSLFTAGNCEKIAIFDGGVMRPTTASAGCNTIGFGTQSTVLFGFDNASTAFDLSRMSIDSLGVTPTSTVYHVISGFNATILVDNDIIYSTSGAAVSAAQLRLIGTYQSSGPIVVDDSISSVFMVNAHVVRVFDRDTFVPIFSLTLSNAVGNPISATGCGSACLAVVFDSNQIFILPNVSDTVFANGFE